MTFRLRRLALLLNMAVLAAMALLLAVPMLGLLAPEGLPLALAFRQLPPVGDPARLPALLVLATPYLAAALAFAHLFRFGRQLRDAEVFTDAAASALRRFGWSLLLAALLVPLSRLGAAALAGFRDGVAVTPGALLGTAVGGAIGLVFLAFAAVLKEATRATEENAAMVEPGGSAGQGPSGR